MYTYADGEWMKHPTVPGGEHVHDVTWWSNAAWAVGSGADDRPEFEAGQIHRYLWRSLDHGHSWMTIHREPFPIPGSGDTRWVNLMPQGDALHLFGYEYNWEESQTQVVMRGSMAGKSTSDRRRGTQQHFAVGTLTLTEERSILWELM